MKITVIGTGYVGLVAGACFSEMGNDVVCADNNTDKIEKLKNCTIPIYEPGLKELTESNVKENRLHFTTDLHFAVRNCEVCFITVGTPQGNDGSADLKYVLQVAKEIAKSMNGYKVIVNKSTVPVGTADKIAQIIKENTNYEFDIVSNPEFLKQGNAVDDFLSPDRVIIGSNSQKATRIMQDIYSPFFRTGNRMTVMDVKSAEMTKYASNAFLATRISFMNEISNLCEIVGADIEMVRVGMSTDSRIGNKYLFAGLGYGGSCFPKDVKAIIKTGTDNNCEMPIMKSVDYTNQKQRERFIKKIFNKFGCNLSNKTFGIWGLSFKPNTNDMREAPSITIINSLLNSGAKIKCYDPKAVDEAKKIFNNKIEYCISSYDAINNSDAMILITEWREFRHPDFIKIKKLLKNPIIFDGRNQYDPKLMETLGFEYYCIGKSRPIKP